MWNTFGCSIAFSTILSVIVVLLFSFYYLTLSCLSHTAWLLCHCHLLYSTSILSFAFQHRQSTTPPWSVALPCPAPSVHLMLPSLWAPQNLLWHWYGLGVWQVVCVLKEVHQCSKFYCLVSPSGVWNQRSLLWRHHINHNLWLWCFPYHGGTGFLNILSFPKYVLRSYTTAVLDSTPRAVSQLPLHHCLYRPALSRPISWRAEHN